jgi:hypothetical protein
MQHNHPFNNDIGIGISQVDLRATPNNSNVSPPKHRFYVNHTGTLGASDTENTIIGGKTVERDGDSSKKEGDGTCLTCGKKATPTTSPLMSPDTIVDRLELSPLQKYTQQLLEGRSIAHIVEDRLALHESFVHLGDTDSDEGASHSIDDTDDCPPLVNNLHEMRSFM